MNNYLNTITAGDGLALLREIPDNLIDVTFADPPFNLKKKYGVYVDALKAEDYLEWCEKWITEMVRVTKPTGSIFVHNIPRWLTYYASYLNKIAEFKHWISWDALSSPMGKSLQPSHYGILYYAKDAKLNKFYKVRHPHKRCRKCKCLSRDYGGKKSKIHPFGTLISDVWTDIHRVRHNKDRDRHPCQLPICLLERIILMSSDEGDVILDPFVGTGTTAVASKRLGRNFVGFDIDYDYVLAANLKLDKVVSHSKIRDVWVSVHSGKLATIRDNDWALLQQYEETEELIFKEKKRFLLQSLPNIVY